MVQNSWEILLVKYFLLQEDYIQVHKCLIIINNNMSMNIPKTEEEWEEYEKMKEKYSKPIYKEGVWCSVNYS